MRFFVAFLFYALSFYSFSQIIQIEDNVQGKKEARTSIILKNSVQSCFRSIEINDYFANSSIEQYENEEAIHLYQMEIILQLPITEIGFLETGIGFYQNGESSNYVDPNSDSTFRYSNQFQYFGLPLKLSLQKSIIKFKSGHISLGISSGFVPLLLNGYNQKRAWTTNFGSRNSETLKDRTYITSYNVLGVLETTIGYHFKEDYGIHLMGNYNKSLMNSFTKYGPYKRKAFSYGISLGLSKSF